MGLARMRWPALAAGLVLALAACGTEPAGAGSEEIVVSAAASLADAFGELESAFEATHPGVDVVLNLAGSATLREQILGGAPVDVFAPANRQTLEPVEAAGLVGAPAVIFARNRMALAVPAGNPGQVTGLDDLARPDLLVGLCAAGVPCGDLARRVLANAGVSAELDTEEPDVRALLTKLEAGELDAGIVYVTDVTAKPGISGFEIPADLNAITDYPITVLRNAPNRPGAEQFVQFVLSDAGREILSRHGFESP